jgi:hypothetical protein
VITERVGAEEPTEFGFRPEVLQVNAQRRVRALAVEAEHFLAGIGVVEAKVSELLERLFNLVHAFAVSAFARPRVSIVVVIIVLLLRAS